MFVAMVDMSIKPADLDEYVAHRQQHINPAMRATGAFRRTHLLRPAQPADAEGSLRCVLMNAWDDLEAQRRFAASGSHAAQLEAMKRLAQITSVRSLERHDGLSYGSGGNKAAPIFVIERHRCRPGQGPAYLAAWTAVRKSFEEIPGCVGVSVYTDMDDQDSFVVVYRWASDSHADAYAAQAGREWTLPSLVHDIVADGLGSAARYSEVAQ